VNPTIPTGEVEVAIRELEVLNPSAPLPFQIDERTTVGEDARLKYRYLDLRRPRQHEALRCARRSPTSSATCSTSSTSTTSRPRR
jgi:aspartyl-tRNA synthetase